MSRHLSREMDNLKSRILSLSTVVEEIVSTAVKTVLDRDKDLAQEVVSADHKIDQLEVEVEEECLKILALHQPLSKDLRFIVACLKINNDLERIGDQAVNIAKRARKIANFPSVPDPFDLEVMTTKVKLMLRDSLDSLVNMDPDLALKVCRSDEEVDAIHKNSYVVTQEKLNENPALSEPMIMFLSVSRNLERIADLAENIAEDVIYMITGEIIRHGNISALSSDSRPNLERVK